VLLPQELLSSLNSVFLLNMMHSLCHFYTTSNIASIDVLEGPVINILQERLETIGSVHDSTIANHNLKRLAKEIAEILQFERQLLKLVLSNVTCLNRSRVLAEQRIERGAVGGEPICEVICIKCCKSTLL
jgi:hypothetical protein